mmetsp:Transcript_30932/g.99321  ORF Transcript_30932/g.99321 Transcript_30932/m.99321 type:complete len:133 (-) Transcript_30932:60-458(-)
MPPPRSVTCTMCGQQFFKASLPFHVKQCRLKTDAIPIPCPGCDREFPQRELRSHMSRCARLKTAQSVRDQGVSVRSSRVLKPQDELPRWRTHDDVVSDFAAQHHHHHDALLGSTSDGRMACRFCGRNFAIDR